ncbi:MAG TPA: acyltransferase family protein [Gemmataceae bacterium]|nr:acyltransferase family protein [Gemmataceae bacterium]
MSLPGREREFDLDPFRGVVCLWLTGMHLCWMSEVHPALVRLVPAGVPDAAYRWRLGVESFLILAGFMTAHMLRPNPGESVRLGTFCLRRACRLVLPFGVAVLWAAADRWAAYLLFGRGVGRPDLPAVLSQLLLVNEWVGVPEAAVGYWTLATLEQVSLLGAAALAIVCCWTANGRSGRYEVAYARMGPIALAAFLGSGAAFLLAPDLPVTLPRYAFYVALGGLLYGHARLGLYRWEFPAALGALIAVAVLTQHSRLTAAVVAVGTLSVLARGARFPGGPAVAALRFIGQRSYSLYLVHAILGIRVTSLWKILGGYPDWVAIPLVLAAAAASLAGAAVFYRWIERPCQALASRFAYRVPAAGADGRISGATDGPASSPPRSAPATAHVRSGVFRATLADTGIPAIGFRSVCPADEKR